MLIAPGIIAFMVCRSFDQMLVVATVVSVVACVLGTLISFHIDGATGPCIVIIQALFFVIALIYNHMTKGHPIALKVKDDSVKNAPKGKLL